MTVEHWDEIAADEAGLGPRGTPRDGLVRGRDA